MMNDIEFDEGAFEKIKPIDEGPFKPEVDYYYIEDIATVRRVDEENILIAVNLEIGHLCAPYFRVYNSSSWEAATAIARLHFKDSGMELEYDERDEKQDVPIWNIPKEKIKLVIDLLSSHTDDFPEYTYWQYACYLWNYENNLVPDSSFIRYMKGKFDTGYPEGSDNFESYIPSTQEMPKTWKFDEEKAKGKIVVR